MVSLQIRIDDTLRNQAQQVAHNLGMDLTTAVRVFLKQMVHSNGLPFKPEVDPFFSARNIEALKKSIASLRAGDVIAKDLHELEDMAELESMT